MAGPEKPDEALSPEAKKLLASLAERIRARRLELGMTVRELAAKSGVSERFLVSLEGGRANVSVVRLAEVAAALDIALAALLPAGKPAVVSQAGAPQLVSLIGLRGAGKSTLGAAAAERLGIPFVELDERITRRAGMTPGEIFDVHGAAFYRRLEREELERVIESGAAAIVATAGSLVTDSATFERLLSATTVVWLKATPEEHFSRVIAQGDLRPMADRKDAMKDLRAILRARRALHERAHHIVDTSALGLARSIDRVVRIVRG